MSDHRVRGIENPEQGFPHGELRQEVDLIDGLPTDLTVDEDVSASSLDLLVKKPQEKTCLSATRSSQHDKVLQVVVVRQAHFFTHRDPEAETCWKGLPR